MNAMTTKTDPLRNSIRHGDCVEVMRAMTTTPNGRDGRRTTRG